MKASFSTHWISSKQPRKQRKYRHNAPLHTKHKFLSANLSKTLREKYGKRNLPLRKGDEVLVMRGASRKKKAKVVFVDLKRSRIVLENLQRTKKEGSKVNIFFSPSSLQIQALNTDDSRRLKKIRSKLPPSNSEKKKSEKKEKSKE